MKEPLIINGHVISGRMPMFQRWGRDAIRAGTKSQTRRIIKHQPICPELYENGWYDVPRGELMKHSYGKPGEIRVMREPLECFEGVIRYADDQKMLWPLTLWRWKRDTLSQMFMPTRFGRTLCRIEDIEVERIQEISEEDAKAEGVTPFTKDRDCWTDGTYKTAYGYKWNEIHGWAPNAWERNKWVFVQSFKRL